MKNAVPQFALRFSPRAYTLVELLVATAVGSIVAGTVLLLLCQTSMEQRSGFADMTVEEKAYLLQANIVSCLRSMSANQGLTPNYTSGLLNSGGNLLGYQSALVFSPSNGAYTTASITYTAASGQVIFTPDVTAPSTQTVWMSNSLTAVLTEFCMSTSFNLDGSQNSSLVNVLFQMNDNGFSQQGATNNPTSIYRNFSVQMRNDN
jgi:prepilin-type N-terminal cleavage/methylation domain-containing protein